FKGSEPVGVPALLRLDHDRVAHDELVDRVERLTGGPAMCAVDGVAHFAGHRRIGIVADVALVEDVGSSDAGNHLEVPVRAESRYVHDAELGAVRWHLTHRD